MRFFAVALVVTVMAWGFRGSEQPAGSDVALERTFGAPTPRLNLASPPQLLLQPGRSFWWGPGAKVPGVAKAGEFSGTPALTMDELYELLAESPWPRSRWGRVVEIAVCESTLNPEAVGAAGEVGILQIHPIHERLWRSLDLEDPADNLIAGYITYLEAGKSFRPWSCA